MLLRSFLLVLLLLPLSAMAQRGWWADDAHEPAASRRQAAQALPHYRPVTVQLSTLRAALRAAPAETSPLAGAGQRGASAAGVLLTLPRPEGGTEQFRARRVTVMAPALAARFPQIQTYQAQSLDHPGTVARLDVAPGGFHAQVLEARGQAYYLDPAAGGDSVHHRVFFRAAGRPAAGWHCGVTLQSASGTTPIRSGAARRGAAGSDPMVLRTFRLAVACTPEYALTKGNTLAGTLAAIVSTVNRVDGVYERELAVRLVLVANNDQLVFLSGLGPLPNPAYSNNNGDAMLLQNQRNVDRLIGPANYDIGHVFSTGGGGIAYTPSACDDPHKAQGVTGAADPSGDAFAIDYVAHEIGHQLGAYHTFNSTQELCGANNRNPDTAYEPGSGTTIMAYAGICAPENIQPNSDPYFHSVSHDEIRAYVEDVGRCGTFSATTNHPPVPVAGRGYFIPKSTPFVLSGAATDPDGDALTYSWEEMDLGPASPLSSPTGEAPLFRVRPPQATPTRYFPQLADVLSDTTTPGEQLPDYGRRLRFRLTVRDNRPDGGALAHDSTSLVVVGAAGPFRVQVPNDSTARWQAGASAEVRWDVAGTTAAPIRAAEVDILLSLDGGLTYPITLAAAAPNNGQATLTLPLSLPATRRARVQVRATGNVFFDVSDADFMVRPASPGLSVSPNPSRGPVVLLLIDAQRGPISLRVFDALGQLVRSEAQSKTAEAWQYTLDLSALSPGLYLVQLFTPDGARQVLRLVRE